MQSTANSDHTGPVSGRDFGCQPSGGAVVGGGFLSSAALARRWTALTGLEWYNAPDPYWRRRFFILAAGLAFVGLITWGLSAALGPATPISAAGSRGAPLAAAPGAAGGANGFGPLPSSLLPASGSSSTAAGKGGGLACPLSHIVLSLFTSQPAYRPGQQPQFQVYAVSTAPAPCDLTFGSSAVRVVVTRAGQVIWDSAGCPPTGSAVASTLRLAPGVPQVAAITWNPRATIPGCAGSVPAGTTGTLTAVAMADGKSSSVRSFALSQS